MILVHVATCVVALVVGAAVALAPKGTPMHRALGLVYVAATLAYSGSSFFMYPSTGRFTPFHVIAIQSVALVSLGLALPRLFRHRVQEWYVWHLRFMLYSYVALVATGLRFVLPYFTPGNRLVPILVFVALPLCSWVWIERRVVPRWRVRLGGSRSCVTARV